jgi:hypothetical protein
MKCLILSAIWLLWAWAEGTEPQTRPQPGDDDDRLLVPLCLIPEMGSVPELDSWSRCEPEPWKEQTAAAAADWKKKSGCIAKLVTPDVARALSGWARPQMKKYHKVPSLEKLDFKPVAAEESGNQLLLEATVDTLPTHSNLVTRWLKLYLLYDVPGKSIVRVTVTIRGQRLE